MAKKQTYINVELDWANEKLLEWRTYIDDNPIATLVDRIEWKTTKTGGSLPIVLSKKEDQIRCIRDTMKEYLNLLEVVNNLREKEDQKKMESRGNLGLSPLETGDI